MINLTRFMLGLFCFLKINKQHYFYNSLLTFFKSNSMVYSLISWFCCTVYLLGFDFSFISIFICRESPIVDYVNRVTSLQFALSLHNRIVIYFENMCWWYFIGGVDVDIFVMGIFRRWFDLIRISCRSALKYLQVMKAFIMIFNWKFLLKYEKLWKNICLWEFFVYSSLCRQSYI